MAYFIDGQGSITAGLTSFAAGTVIIGGQASLDIGGAGTFLQLSTAAVDVSIDDIPAGRTVNIGPAASTTLSTVFKVNRVTGTLNIVGGSSSTITTVRLGQRGSVNIDSSVVVTNLDSAGMVARVRSNSTALTTAVFASGVGHELARSAATLTIGQAASVSVRDEVAVSSALNLYGQINWNSTGTITAATFYPGSRLIPGNSRFTITNCTIYEGASVPLRHPLITFTNAPTLVGRTGE